MERSDAPEGSGFMRRRKPADGSTVSRFPQTPTGCISGPGAISFIFIMAALRQLPRMLRTEELSEEEEEESSVFITVPAAQLDKMQRQLPLLQEHAPAANLHQRQVSAAMLGHSSPPGLII